MNTITSLLLLSLFVFVFSAKFSPVLAQSGQILESVRDIAGNELQTGVEYFILPVARGMGGGVTLGSNVNSTKLCPLQVVQNQREVEDGQQVTFTPVNPNEGIIRLITDLNIKFSQAVTTCIQSMVWRLDSDELTGRRFISTNGVEGNPGIETLSNWFNIQKDGDDYKLVFCPSVCNFCRPNCGDIGIYRGGDRVRRLAIKRDAERSFKIMFKRA